MPPGGIHLAAGLALARYVLPHPRLPAVVPLKHSSTFRAAIVFGSICPDLDLFPAALAVAATWDKTWLDVVRAQAPANLCAKYIRYAFESAFTVA